MYKQKIEYPSIGDIAFAAKEKTAPYVSVGADTEQPFKIITTRSITDSGENFNTPAAIPLFGPQEPALKTVTLQKLFDTTFIDSPPIVENLLYPGTYLFVGTPKVGKSFLMAQLAYHVSTGTPLWNYPTAKGTVLYLALEDGYSRLQKRMYRMVGETGNENLHFAVSAGKIDSGLHEQITDFLTRHTDTRLIIIDTLKMIREDGDDRYSYGSDYELINHLRIFSDRLKICILVVHHTRKESASDVFDMISGTNGLLGAADGGFVLYKERRTSNEATLDVVGRDQPDQKLHLVRNTETLAWDFQSADTELWKEPPEPILEVVAAKLPEEGPPWQGSPTELAELLGTDLKPNSLSMKLNMNATRLFNEYGILYQNTRTHDGRKITLTRMPAKA